MALPSLHSELVSLRNLQETLQKRLDLERAYTSSLAAWRTDALGMKPRLMPGLTDLFLSLVEGAENNIQSRQDMETRFESQIEGVLGATEKLHGYIERIVARSNKLDEFDQLARKALEERKLRYNEWKAWAPQPVYPITIGRGWRRSKPKNSPAAPTERAMAYAYDLADMQVRRWLSTADVARCSFKDKAISEIDVIAVAYQEIIDAITKCLRLFAEDQQECASNASAVAGRIVKLASDTFGFRLAGTFQDALASEAQNISTASMPYDDPKSISRYPTIKSQPIILGFSLPPCYFSCTASTKFVVNVFCQLVSFVHGNRAWGDYSTHSTTVDYSIAPTFLELERSWTGDEALNQGILSSLGTSMCTDLVKTLLASFPEPLLDCSVVPAGNLRLWNLDIGQRPNTTWSGPIHHDSGMDVVPLVSVLYNHPQGEMLRALCSSLIPVFRGESVLIQDRICEIFSDLLTRKGECIKNAFPMLVRRISTITTTIDKRSALPAPRNTALPIRLRPPINFTQISSTSASPSTTPSTSPPASPLALRLGLAPNPLPAVRYGPQNTAQAILTTAEVEPKLDKMLSNNPTDDSTRPRHTAPISVYGLHINAVNFLKHGIVKTSKNKANASYTILLVGEAGGGKSSLLKYIANVLLGNDIDHLDPNILEEEDAVGEPVLPYLYEITSVSGLLVRILDTPGLPDGIGIEKDEIHKESIVRYIEQYVDFVNAILILSYGTNPRSDIDVDYTFSALSALLPKTLVKNIAFIYTDLVVPPSLNDRQGMVPGALKNAPMFFFDNSIVHYIRINLREGSRLSLEPNALKMLVELFDWLDSLEPHPATEIVSLYENYRNIEVMTIDILQKRAQEVDTRIEIDSLMIALEKHSADMDTFSNFEQTVVIPVLKQQRTTTQKNDNQVLVDEDMKKKWGEAKDGKETTATLIAVHEMVLHHLNPDTSYHMLVQLVEQYANLSLVGSLSAQVRNTVRYLEQYIAKAKTRIRRHELQKVSESLGHMKGRLEVLIKVEDAQKGVSG